MKIFISMRQLTALALVIYLPVLSAQTVIATLEAESGTLTLPAKVKYVSGYSGNAYVGDFDPGSSIVFDNVEIANEGTYEIKTYYTSMQLRSIAIKSNEFTEAISSIVTATQDWNAPPAGTMSTYIYLNKGANKIRITPYPVGQGGPNIDKFEILTTTVSIPKPGELPLLLEAETARLYGDLKVKPTDGSTITGLSGGKYIGDFNLPAKSYLQFVDIEIPEEGTYELKVFSMGSGRKLAIKVNQYEKTIITTKNSPDWNNAPASVTSTLLYMDKGKNRITMSLHNDNGPNLDKFEIHQTNQIIPKPKIERISFISSHADEAEITAQHNNETLTNLTDNNEYTFYKVTGVTTTQLTAKCKQPVLLTGYLLSAGINEKADVSQWTIESSTNGTTWKTISPNNHTDLSGGMLYTVNRNIANAASECAQYYRLTAKGNTDINVAEWQLFGVPYTTNIDGKTFPRDITEGLNPEQNASGYPTGASGDSWSEKFYNLFDRKLTTKYYSGSTKQFYVEVRLEKNFKLQSYSLTSVDNYPDRDPAKWTLNGYNDEQGWVEIDRRTDFKFPSRCVTMRFDVNNDTPFNKFLLDVEDNNGSSDSQLLKFQLFGNEFTGETGFKNAVNTNITIGSEHGKISIYHKNTPFISYSVYSTSGILLKKGISSGSQKDIEVGKGVYIVTLNDNAGNYNKKVIVL